MVSRPRRHRPAPARRPPATPASPRDPPRHQHMSKYGSYDPYIAQHMSKYGSYDPNIAQHRKKYRKFENPKFCRKFQILKMTQKSFSAYPKIPKSDFSKFIEFYIKSRTSIPSGGLLSIEISNIFLMHPKRSWVKVCIFR